MAAAWRQGRGKERQWGTVTNPEIPMLSTAFPMAHQLQTQPQVLVLCITHKSQGSGEKTTSATELSSLHTHIHVPKKIKKATYITLWLICSEMSL